MSAALLVFLIVSSGGVCHRVDKYVLDDYAVRVSCDHGRHRYIVDDYPRVVVRPARFP